MLGKEKLEIKDTMQTQKSMRRLYFENLYKENEEIEQLTTNRRRPRRRQWDRIDRQYDSTS